MSNGNFNFYNQKAAKFLLRQNKNYFEWLFEHFGEPTEYGDRLKIAWQTGNRKVIYFAQVFVIQLLENPDGNDLKWKLVETKSYPTKENIEFCSNWLNTK